MNTSLIIPALTSANLAASNMESQPIPISVAVAAIAVPLVFVALVYIIVCLMHK